MRGRKPIPTAVKAMRGTLRNRDITDEPSVRSGLPLCPKHLDKAARKEWQRVGKELKALGVMTHLDFATLAVYCQEWSRIQRLEKIVQDEGEVIPTTRDGVRINPNYTALCKAYSALRQCVVELGFTPSSRARVRVPAKVGPVDPMEVLLSGAGTEN